MVSSGLVSIRTESANLNLAKTGATSLFVDQLGVNASDDNDGFDWDRPFLTIMGAMAMANPWTEVFIRTGVYPENVVIPYENIKLHGAVQSGLSKVSIAPVSGVPLTIQHEFCCIGRMELVSTDAYGCVIGADNVVIHDIDSHITVTGAAKAGIRINGGANTRVSNAAMTGNNTLNSIGILIDGGATDVGIIGSYFTAFGDALNIGYAIAIEDAQRVSIVPSLSDGQYIPNRFNANHVGVYFYPMAGYRGHCVHGNGFWGHTSSYDIYDNNDPDVSGIVVDGNFYGYTGWFTDHNHDGIADLLVDCYNNVDYHPLAGLQSWRVHPIPRIDLE